MKTIKTSISVEVRHKARTNIMPTILMNDGASRQSAVQIAPSSHATSHKAQAVLLANEQQYR